MADSTDTRPDSKVDQLSPRDRRIIELVTDALLSVNLLEERITALEAGIGSLRAELAALVSEAS